ncbi:hypothetical protein CANARDRAFT_222380 [[Candida] arabinofermentans NRRL YB-2248]|uniref:NAD(P)H-hydrate epimerase n=1 Tax=[Candida] arabinofermentans NRRL YB-2248 TaxID=983967 RepID=A0A1E4SZN2_9ASCO|nr:hypothetical protein CANARDRAFT_222380 [[Candida] arabinofermentans NRRL YB-2248]
MSFKVIASKHAALLDQELMSTCGFTIDQLMELAGLSVAQSIYKVYPPSTHTNCLILCGPGNNGGDGLVAARHLKLFGYKPIIYYPKPTKRPLFDGLVTQLKLFNIEFISSGNQLSESFNTCDLIVDALFGFSFHPPIRQPFDSLISQMIQSHKKIVAVDVPSGWDVDEGPVIEQIKNYQPDLLVSLTAPKPCSLKLADKSRHFVGGRFIDPQFAAKWGIDLPNYKGTDQCVELT